METVKTRIRKCRLLEKMRKYPEFSKQLGLVNRSKKTIILEVSND